MVVKSGKGKWKIMGLSIRFKVPSTITMTESIGSLFHEAGSLTAKAAALQGLRNLRLRYGKSRPWESHSSVRMRLE